MLLQDFLLTEDGLPILTQLGQPLVIFERIANKIGGAGRPLKPLPDFLPRNVEEAESLLMMQLL